MSQNVPDPLIIAERTFTSRLLVGTGKYRDMDETRAAIEATGLTQVLVETDAPYLTPHPHRGKANSSYLMPWTVRTLADVAAMDVASVCDATRTATRRAFALA